MVIRSDLALELTTGQRVRSFDEFIKVTDIKIDEAISKKIGKPMGDYVTIESRIAADGMTSLYKRLADAIAGSLKKFTKRAKNVLVIGLGNPDLTADALGSKVFRRLIVTRHIREEFLQGTVKLSAFCPNVMGVTGIESFDVISGIVQKIRPDLVIAVDSLASAAVSRLASAFQICSSGITPGSGVSNHRKRLDKASLGTNVISIGVPMVVYADIIISEALKNFEERDEVLDNLEAGISSLIVTPKEIDVLVEDCAEIIATAINTAFDLKENIT